MAMKPTEEEAKRIGAAVDRIADAVVAHVAHEEPLPAALALAKLGAEHIYHDGGDREDFLRICESAWNVVEKAHVGGQCSH